MAVDLEESFWGKRSGERARKEEKTRSARKASDLGSWCPVELIQTQMTQKPMLRAEVYARALRASQNRKEDSV